MHSFYNDHDPLRCPECIRDLQLYADVAGDYQSVFADDQADYLFEQKFMDTLQWIQELPEYKPSKKKRS